MHSSTLRCLSLLAGMLTQQGMRGGAQRDVLGFSRSAVPVLVGQGIQAVTVGTNGGCAPPAVPHNTPFIWRDVRSGAQLLAMWHPGAGTCLPLELAVQQMVLLTLSPATCVVCSCTCTWSSSAHGSEWHSR